MTDHPPPEVAARHPRWNIWIGRATGKFWAVPMWDAPVPIVEASTIAELENRMAEMEEQ